MSESLSFTGLLGAIEQTNLQLTLQARQAVNLSLTMRNWLIGHYIDEYQLQGSDRATYGDNLLRHLSVALQEKGIANVGIRQLYDYLAFFRAYPQKMPTLSALSMADIVPTVSAQLQSSLQLLFQRLSYSHLKELVAVEDDQKRVFYERQCLQSTWSLRELKRQIASLYYERTALSTNKRKLERQTRGKSEIEPVEFPIRDPYVFEFLGLKPVEVMREADLEEALLDKLQAFLLELGHGFCFEARQKRLLIGDSHFFVDLVFYHRLLKCHVLIELKTERFSHEHVGQLNTYVSWYAENMQSDGDNPPIGLLLCTERDHTVVKYALAGMSNQLFVSKYQVAMPTVEQITSLLGGQVS